MQILMYLLFCNTWPSYVSVLCAFFTATWMYSDLTDVLKHISTQTVSVVVLVAEMLTGLFDNNNTSKYFHVFI